MFRKAKETCSFKEIEKAGFAFRNKNKFTCASHSAQHTMITLQNSMKSFFSLRKRDKTAKYPYKFKSYKYFCSFKYTNGVGIFKRQLFNSTNLIKN